LYCKEHRNVLLPLLLIILQLSGLVWDNPGEMVPEETFTHSHLLWSSIIPYLLPPSFMIHGILLVQFTYL